MSMNSAADCHASDPAVGKHQAQGIGSDSARLGVETPTAAIGNSLGECHAPRIGYLLPTRQRNPAYRIDFYSFDFTNLPQTWGALVKCHLQPMVPNSLHSEYRHGNKRKVWSYQ